MNGAPLRAGERRPRRRPVAFDDRQVRHDPVVGAGVRRVVRESLGAGFRERHERFGRLGSEVEETREAAHGREPDVEGVVRGGDVRQFPSDDRVQAAGREEREQDRDVWRTSSAAPWSHARRIRAIARGMGIRTITALVGSLVAMGESVPCDR